MLFLILTQSQGVRIYSYELQNTKGAFYDRNKNYLEIIHHTIRRLKTKLVCAKICFVKIEFAGHYQNETIACEAPLTSSYLFT